MREQAVHAGHGIADRHGAGGIAVIAAPGREEAGALLLADALLVLQGHLQRHLHRNGTGIRQKNTCKALRQHGQQAFAQFHGGCMGQAAEHHMRHPPGLTLGRGHQTRMIVTVDGRPPRGHAVHQLPAVVQHDAVMVAARGREDRQRIHHGRVRMPEDASVPQRQGIFRARSGSLTCHGRYMPGQRGQQHGAGIGQLLPARRIQPGHAGQDDHRRILAPGRQTARTRSRS